MVIVQGFLSELCVMQGYAAKPNIAPSQIIWQGYITGISFVVTQGY